MLLKKEKFNYKNVYGYIAFLALMIVFNNVSFVPLSVCLYTSSLICEYPLLISSLLFTASVGIKRSLYQLVYALAFSAIASLLTFVYRKTQSPKKTLFLLLDTFSTALFGFTMILEGYGAESLIVPCTAIFLMSFLSYVFVSAVSTGLLDKKYTLEEKCVISVMAVLFGLGSANAVSPYLLKSTAILIILFMAYLSKENVLTFSCLMGASLSIYYQNVSYASLYLFLGLFCLVTCVSRFIPAVLLLCFEYLLERVFSVYGGFSEADIISTLVPVLIFCCIPSKSIDKLKERLIFKKENKLERIAINRNRQMLSNKLYDLSGIFLDIKNSFISFKKCGLSEEKSKEHIKKQVLSACADCDYKDRCKRKTSEFSLSLSKIIDIGFAKGKLSLIDMPVELANTCMHPNTVLFTLNKMLGEYRSSLIESQNSQNGRNIIALQSEGVAEVLSSLALEWGNGLKYQTKLERKIANLLTTKGINATEILIYGDTSVSVSIVVMGKADSEYINGLVSSSLGFPTEVVEHFELMPDKHYISIKKSPKISVLFGVSREVKDGSVSSGDTHSITRLNNDRVLLAISDGMGSGEKANEISSTSLSLIESFYKAGIKSDLILNTVNKLMSINSDDTFSALDISVIDLKDSTADFIKYGVPYGFIVGENGIRIVEGNTLPLGILGELTPSSCKTKLALFDTVLLVSDGISDSFSSSGELIDYIKTVKFDSPQTLTDSLIKKAVQNNNGKKKDDMTAIAVKIIKTA